MSKLDQLEQRADPHCPCDVDEQTYEHGGGHGGGEVRYSGEIQDTCACGISGPWGFTPYEAQEGWDDMPEGSEA